VITCHSKRGQAGIDGAGGLSRFRGIARRGALDIYLDVIDPDALATQIHYYRTAVQLGISETAARSDAVMKNTTHWPAG
jgi:hypothetical protein